MIYSVACPTLTNPPAGSVSITTDGITSMVTYVCVQGYYYNGSLTSECSTSGNWSSEAPICSKYAHSTIIQEINKVLV